MPPVVCFQSFIRRPISAASDGFMPIGDKSFKFVRFHFRAENRVIFPAAFYFVLIFPETCRNSRKTGGPKGGRFSYDRAHNRKAADIGLKLHQKLIPARAAVNFKIFHFDVNFV